jgi:hypothetical protein
LNGGKGDGSYFAGHPERQGHLEIFKGEAAASARDFSDGNRSGIEVGHVNEHRLA